MESEQRSTEDDNIYEIDDGFIEKVRSLPIGVSLDIAKQLDRNAANLPRENGWYQYVSGVSNKGDEPIYFLVTYLKQEGEHTVYLDFIETNSDEYLDNFNQDKILK